MPPKGVAKPNYTQAPNIFFDEYIKEMGEAEYKIVACVIRYTFGYHRISYPMSLSFLQDKTGLSREAVIAGTERAMTRGVIDRSALGNSYEYWMVVNETDYPEEGWSTEPTSGSQRNRLAVVNGTDQSGHALKKAFKENSKEIPSIPAPVVRVWESAFGLLANNLSDVSDAWDKWVQRLRLIGFEDGTPPVYVLDIRREEARQILEIRLKPTIVRTLSQVAGCDVAVKFVLASEFVSSQENNHHD